MAIEPNLSGDSAEKALITYILDCKGEAEHAKHDRMELNKDNYAMYQLRHDFSHKTEGQSREVLPKVRMATEQIKSFFQQALADLEDWFDAQIKNDSIPEEALPIRPNEIKKLLTYMHERMGYFSHVGNSVQSGLLGGLIITKTSGKMCSKPTFRLKTEGRGKNFKRKLIKTEDKTWELVQKIIRQEDYYPDPTGNGLYEIEYCELDLHEVVRLSKGEDAIYDADAVKELSRAMNEDLVRQHDKDRETGQNESFASSGHRPKVRILEFWGSVVNSEGELEHENVVMTLANEQHLIRKPTANPLWHQESPYNTAPLLEVANSVWPIALMDAPTKLNRTMIELYCLIIDAAFKRVHAISQVRVNDLVDATQVANGIPSGAKLLVKSSLPHGAKVMENVDEADVPADAVNILNIHQQEFNASSLTNDLRQGVMAFRQVKATEVITAEQSITSVFQGVAKNIEARLIMSELQKQLFTLAQNWQNISREIFISLFGQERGEQLSQLSPEEVFVTIAEGYKFKIYGISQTLSRVQDFRNYTTLLQTIGSSDLLIEEFIKKYDFSKLLGEVMTSLSIDKEKIKSNQQEAAAQSDPLAGATPGPNGEQASTPSPDQGAGDMFAQIFGQAQPAPPSAPGAPQQ